MEAVELVEVLIAIEDPAGCGRVFRLVGFAHEICRGQWLAIHVGLLCILLGCGLLCFDLQDSNEAVGSLWQYPGLDPVSSNLHK